MSNKNIDLVANTLVKAFLKSKIISPIPSRYTKKIAAKRYKITGSGNISYTKGGNSHFGVRKSSKRKRSLRRL